MCSSYKIIYSKRKSIGLHLDREGNLTIRAPKGVSKKRIDEVVKEKSQWISNKRNEIQNRPKYELDPEVNILQAKKNAREIITSRVNYWSAIMGISTNVIRINSAKTRWGSCGSGNSLNFTWKLALCPIWVIDYVVVHELCHFEHKNHGRFFWQKVASEYPNYKLAQKWLKDNSNIIEIC